MSWARLSLRACCLVGISQFSLSWWLLWAMWFLSSGRDVKHSGQVSRARSLAQIAILSLICTFALYPIYHKGFLGGHAQSAVDKVGNSLQILRIHACVWADFAQDIFTPLLLCAMAMVAIWIAIKLGK